MNETPTHLLPERCYICGGAEHPPTSGHSFWSNADAAAEFAAEDARTITTRSPEAAYVAQHRPY